MSSAAFTTRRALIADARRDDLPGTTPDVRERLALAYGAHLHEVRAIVRAAPDLARPLSPDCAVTLAEILHAVRHEAAVTLADAVARRTEAGTSGHPGHAALAAAGAVMATALGWTPEHLAREAQRVAALYPPP